MTFSFIYLFILGLKRLNARPGSLSPNTHHLYAWVHQNYRGKSPEFPLVGGIAPHVNQVRQGFFFSGLLLSCCVSLRKPLDSLRIDVNN